MYLLIKMAGWTEKHEDGVKRLPSRAYLNITEPLWQAEELMNAKQISTSLISNNQRLLF